MKKIKKFLTISLQIYICLNICASLNAQNMEFFVDSMMNSNEGYEMYEYYMGQPVELADSTEKSLFAWSMVEHYYTHMFYTMHHSHVFDQYCDSLKSDICYNNLFELSEPDDDFLEGFRLFTGRVHFGFPEYCDHDHGTLMNLPLPENSLPDNPVFEFDLNPDNNPFTENIWFYNLNTSYDRIEMYNPNSGNDWHIDEISRNPPSGNRSIRLNNYRNMGHSKTMERTFLVGTEDSLLTFYLALVMEDPGHIPEHQPYFKALILDEEDEVIDELCWTSGDPESGMEAILVESDIITYLDWSCYEFDVSNHKGKK